MSQKHSPNHSHSHSGHHHHHHHSHGEVVGRMSWAFFLNLSFAIIELIGGLWTNSVAILSDALHDFGDALAMIIAIVLEKVSIKKSDENFSYGYRRFSTLGAVVTGMVLIFGSIIILVEAIPRLFNPVQPNANGMIFLAFLGLAVNGYAAFKVSKGESLNEKMLMWHMIEDVLGWAMVLVGAFVMKFFDVPQLDAGMAIALALWILYNVVRNMKEAVQVLLMATPSTINIEDVEALIKKVASVLDVHHSHLWSLDGQSHIYTAHVVLPVNVSQNEAECVKMEIKKIVKSFGIIEATIETEISGSPCVDPEHN